MFWPHPAKNVPFCHSQLLLDDSASFTSSNERLVSKWKVKLIFRGAWNSLRASADRPWAPNYILRQIYSTASPCSSYLEIVAVRLDLIAGRPMSVEFAELGVWAVVEAVPARCARHTGSHAANSHVARHRFSRRRRRTDDASISPLQRHGRCPAIPRTRPGRRLNRQSTSGEHACKQLQISDDKHFVKV